MSCRKSASEIGKLALNSSIPASTHTKALQRALSHFLQRRVFIDNVYSGLSPEIVHFRTADDGLGSVRGDWYIKGTG